MFERYTETARRSVFFARYEASQFGSPQIEPEHLLLGVLREDAALAVRLFGAPQRIAQLREAIERHRPAATPIKVSVDLPVSQECRRAMVRASDEASAAKQKHIGAGHLLIGLFLEEKSFAAEIMRQFGITLPRLKQEAEPGTGAPPVARREQPALAGARDLTAAEPGPPLVGRDRELNRLVQILSRRQHNHAALVGAPGVGKTAIVEGLARTIADGTAPTELARRRVLSADARILLDPKTRISKATTEILCIEGALDYAAHLSEWRLLDAIHTLEVVLGSGMRCIATGTPAGWRALLEKAPMITRQLEVIEVAPPDETLALEILRAVQPQYEQFHDVVFAEDAAEAAIRASAVFLPRRYLPERAIDLLDDAAARVRLRREKDTPEIQVLRAKARRLAREIETAIANHEFDQASQISVEERNTRQEIYRLEEERKQAAPENRVSAAEIEEAIAGRTGMPPAAVRTVLAQPHPERLQTVLQALAAAVPVEANEWARFLAAYLVTCSKEDAESLAQAIRDAKARISG